MMTRRGTRTNQYTLVLHRLLITHAVASILVATEGGYAAEGQGFTLKHGHNYDLSHQLKKKVSLVPLRAAVTRPAIPEKLSSSSAFSYDFPKKVKVEEHRRREQHSAPAKTKLLAKLPGMLRKGGKKSSSITASQDHTAEAAKVAAALQLTTKLAKGSAVGTRSSRRLGLRQEPKAPDDSTVSEEAVTGEKGAVGALDADGVGTDASEVALPDRVLDKITSIDCLEEKIEEGARADCIRGPVQNPTEVLPAGNMIGTQHTIDEDNMDNWGLGNYPNFQDPRCRADGEYFCDPDNLLGDMLHANITEALRRFRNEVVVKCGQGNASFALGIALAGKFPASETDPESLETFGKVLMANWGMTGSESEANATRSTGGCPTYGLIVLLAEPRLPAFVAPNCEYICDERGGDEVLAALRDGLGDPPPEGFKTFEGMYGRTMRKAVEKVAQLNKTEVTPDVEALYQSLLGGIHEVQQVLRYNTPLSNISTVPTPSPMSVSRGMAEHEPNWVALQRVAALILCIGIPVILVAFFMFGIHVKPPKS